MPTLDTTTPQLLTLRAKIEAFAEQLLTDARGEPLVRRDAVAGRLREFLAESLPELPAGDIRYDGGQLAVVLPPGRYAVADTRSVLEVYEGAADLTETLNSGGPVEPPPAAHTVTIGE